MLFSELAAKVIAQPSDSWAARLVTICGRGGSGKSTFASHLATALQCIGATATILKTDDFAYWNHQSDWMQRCADALEPLMRGEQSTFATFDWAAKAWRAPITVAPTSVVIVEGVTATDPVLKKWPSFDIFLNLPTDESVRRGKERDLSEGVDALVGDEAELVALWKQWATEENALFARTQPELTARLVVDTSGALDAERFEAVVTR